MTQKLNDLTHALLEAATKAGADSADAMALKGTSVSIDVRNGALEQAERSEATDIGLRVLVGKQHSPSKKFVHNSSSYPFIFQLLVTTFLKNILRKNHKFRKIPIGVIPL